MNAIRRGEHNEADRACQREYIVVTDQGQRAPSAVAFCVGVAGIAGPGAVCLGERWIEWVQIHLQLRRLVGRQLSVAAVEEPQPYSPDLRFGRPRDRLSVHL